MLMESLEHLWLGKPLWMWLAFLAIVVTLLALDLGVLHKKQREIGVSESLILSAGVHIRRGASRRAFNHDGCIDSTQSAAIRPFRSRGW